MVTSSDKDKVHKHYLHHTSFELDHHRDFTYPLVEPHYHEFYEMLYFISGHVNYIIGDELYHLQNDDLLIIPPNVLHNPVFTDFDVPYERFVLWISVSTLKQLAATDPELSYFLKSDAPKRYLLRRNLTTWGNLRTIFTSLEQALIAKEPLYHAKVKTFILHLLVEYNLALLEDCGAARPGSRDSFITNILHYIQTHITEDLSLDTISNTFYIDKYAFSKLFKEIMSISYYQYVLHQRLLMGKNMILEGLPAHKVCFSCGFKDYTSFYRAFKNAYGVSPSVFKKNHLNNL